MGKSSCASYFLSFEVARPVSRSLPLAQGVQLRSPASGRDEKSDRSRSAPFNDAKSVRVGLIHSLSGTMALSERPLLEAELMAIDEINETGGILGCQIEPVTMDGASAPETFAQKAQELLSSGVQFLFGCWTSASRKAVKPIVEDADGLLWYPVQYEGLEESEHIVYTGSCPVQQIVPAVEWVLAHIGSRIFLVGSDYVFPRTANNLTRSLVENSRGSIVGERYVPQGGMDFASIIEEIQRQKPDAVFSTVSGESNLAFYRQYHAAGIDAQSIPVMAVCLSETELQPIANVAAGHYACRNYFQSLNRPENQRFVANFKKRCGEAAVCSAPLATAYTEIYLWKRVVEAAGSFDAAQVRSHVAGCEFVGPTGPIAIQQNHHTRMCAYIGRATPHGQFEVLDVTYTILPWPWLGIEGSKLRYKAAVKEAMAAYPNVQNALVELAAADKGFRETSRLNRLLLDSIPNPTVLVGADHVVLGANRVALEIGVKIGEPCWQRFCKGQYRDVRLAEQAMDENETKHCETEMHGRVWDTFWVPIRKDAYLHYVVDITERKKIERMKDQFVSIVSHELRTPLTSIRASLGLVASGFGGVLPEKGQRMLEIAVTNTDRLVRLINDILDTERLASGKTPMEKKQCSTAQLVTQAADVMKPMAEKAGISFSVESQDAALWADPDRIVQALTNLISNAIKFSPKGGRICVTAERKENQILFRVQDEGRGIPPDKLGMLFERFQQVDSSDARERGGSGLGLSISRSIIEQHNGRIWVESTVGKGSTFFFTIPLLPEVQVPLQPEATTGAPSTRKVLIIEDDPDLANILAAMLERHDIQPHIALTGGKGIALSKQMHPNLIVLDLILPDMDGSIVVEALRKDNTLRSVPLVVYTVKELDKQQRENLRLGETLFFTKSRVPPEQFEEKVVQFMERILDGGGRTDVN